MLLHGLPSFAAHLTSDALAGQSYTSVSPLHLISQNAHNWSMPSRSNLVIVKLRTAAGQFRYLPRAIQLVWTAAGRWTSVWLSLLVFQGLLPAATVCLTSGLGDNLVSATRGHSDCVSPRPPIVFPALMSV